MENLRQQEKYVKFMPTSTAKHSEENSASEQIIYSLTELYHGTEIGRILRAFFFTFYAFESQQSDTYLQFPVKKFSVVAQDTDQTD